MDFLRRVFDFRQTQNILFTVYVDSVLKLLMQLEMNIIVRNER